MHEGPVGLVFSKGAYTQEDKKTYDKSVNAALFLETVSDSHIPFPFCKGQGGYDKYSDDSDFMDALDEAFAQWTEEELSYERLLQEYGADGIATCMFVNAPGRSYAIVYDGEDNVRESLVMFVRNDKGTEEEPAVYAHEILHVFGAHDLYRGEEYSRAVTDYIAANYPDEIMRSVAGEGRISEQISRITAYHLGWIDEIPETESFPELIR